MSGPPLKPWEKMGLNNQSIPDARSTMSSDILNTVVGGANCVPPPIPSRPSQQGLAPSYGMIGYSGGYGSMYNPGYTGGMYGGGLGSYGMAGRYGMQDNFGPNSFVQQAEASSRHAFQSIESIVQAFGSVAMMLESSFYAVYNSFRAVIGVADHFSRMKAHFSQIFSALAIYRTLRWAWRKLLILLQLQEDSVVEDIWQQSAAPPHSEHGDKKPAANWPILLFISIAVGGPWLIWRILKSFSTDEAEKEWANGNADHFVAVAEFDFNAEGDDELSFRSGQQITIAPKELQPRMRGWLLASADGKKTGIIPANYVKLLGKRRGRHNPVAQSNTQPSSIAQSNAQPWSVAQSNTQPWSVAQSNTQPSSVAQSNTQPSSVAQSNTQLSSLVQSNTQPLSVAQSNTQPWSVAQSNTQPSSVAQSNAQPWSVALDTATSNITEDNFDSIFKSDDLNEKICSKCPTKNCTGGLLQDSITKDLPS